MLKPCVSMCSDSPKSPRSKCGQLAEFVPLCKGIPAFLALHTALANLAWRQGRTQQGQRGHGLHTACSKQSEKGDRVT